MVNEELLTSLQHASYATESTRISIPDDLFVAMSQPARIFFWAALDLEPGLINAHQFLTEWDEGTRQIFAEQSPGVQMEILAFMCCITHEWTHHFDLLGTPFGANMHAKFCREYLAFQRWAPTLIRDAPELFDAPLTDWLAVHPAGPEEARRLISTGPLGQAEVELRGPGLFDEVMRDAFPRRIRTGWGEHSDLPMVRLAGDRQYEKVTVNELWTTIRGPNESTYVSPYQIIEGRAFALNLVYMWHLLGGHGGSAGAAGGSLNSIQVMRTYLHTYYAHPDAARRYLTALEIIGGRSVDELLAAGDPHAVDRVLSSTVIATWYALHSPPPVTEDDVRQSLTGRFIAAARVTTHNDPARVKGEALGLMRGIDDITHEIGSKPASILLEQAAQVIQATREENRSCADNEMRDWFNRLLRAIEVTARRRAPAGYASSWGLCGTGNVLDAIDEPLDVGVGQLADAPERVREWHRLRRLILYKRGYRQDKIVQLRTWFGSCGDGATSTG